MPPPRKHSRLTRDIRAFSGFKFYLGDLNITVILNLFQKFVIQKLGVDTGCFKNSRRWIGCQEVKLLSVLRTKITSVISLTSCLPNLCSSDCYPPLPSLIREGACSRKSFLQANSCHCERQNGASQSHNLYNINEITTSNASHSPRNDMKDSCKPQVLDGTATFPRNDIESLCRTQMAGAAATLPQRGEGISNYNQIIYNNQPSPQPSPTGEEVSNYKMLKQVQHDTNSSKRTYSPIHLFSYSPCKRCAFTLAEVLITLGIIGVVAAMTMPTLINSTQKQELVAQYKKTYSVLSQAYMMLLNDNGGSLEGVFTSSNSYIDVFSKYIKDVKTCRTNEEVTRCYLDSFKTLTGRVVNSDVGSTLTTPDGAILLFYHINNSCIGTRELDKPIGCGRIRVDVNGTKKPNTVGYDIFDFYITQNGIIPRGHEDTTVEEDELDGWGRGITILTKGKIDY